MHFVFRWQGTGACRVEAAVGIIARVTSAFGALMVVLGKVVFSVGEFSDHIEAMERMLPI